MRLFIGVDPGVSGGIAVVDHLGLCLFAKAMPTTEKDLLEALTLPWGARGPITVRALIEKVGASPQMGVVSAFTFGKNYGKLLMALTAAGTPFDEISPIKWQNLMGCLTGGDKNVSKRRAQQLFPNITVVHAIADALLLAECCRRLESARAGVRHGKEEVREEGAGEPPAIQGIDWGKGPNRTVPSAPPPLATATGDGAGPRSSARQPLRSDRRRS